MEKVSDVCKYINNGKSTRCSIKRGNRYMLEIFTARNIEMT